MQAAQERCTCSIERRELPHVRRAWNDSTQLARCFTIIVLECVGELIELGIGHSNAAAFFAPTRDGGLDFLNDPPGS